MMPSHRKDHHGDIPLLSLIAPHTYTMPCVYLLHLHRPFKHCKHYIGKSLDLGHRIDLHRYGLSDSCSFMSAAYVRGIGFDLARVWRFATDDEAGIFEQALKKSHNGGWHCPMCRPLLVESSRKRMMQSRIRRKARESLREELALC